MGAGIAHFNALGVYKVGFYLKFKTGPGGPGFLLHEGHQAGGGYDEDPRDDQARGEAAAAALQHLHEIDEDYRHLAAELHEAVRRSLGGRPGDVGRELHAHGHHARQEEPEGEGREGEEPEAVGEGHAGDGSLWCDRKFVHGFSRS